MKNCHTCEHLTYYDWYQCQHGWIEDPYKHVCDDWEGNEKWRYIYTNRVYRHIEWNHGLLCNPVRYPNGKCVAHGGKQLVEFPDGTRQVVIRRCLRVIHGNNFGQ